MHEVHNLPPPTGAIAIKEILPRLKPSVHRGARLHKGPLDAATLRKQLRVRTYHRKYIAEGDDGHFLRRAV